MPVAVVTDSTAYLPAELSGTYDLTVVPLTVVINGAEGLEGLEIQPAEVARALERAAGPRSAPPGRPRRSSPRPTGRCWTAGADGIVSVHLSAKLSGTFEAARLAAAELGDRVQVVDSGTTGHGPGLRRPGRGHGGRRRARPGFRTRGRQSTTPPG